MHLTSIPTHGKPITLSLNEPFLVPIGKTPSGKYAYHVNVLNPANDSPILKVFINNKNVNKDEHVYKLSEITAQIEYNFDTTGKEENTIVFLLTRGTGLTLQLPVSPVMVQEVKEEVSMLLGLDDKIVSKVGELESEDQATGNKRINREPYTRQQSASATSLREMEQYINARYFRGFLSVEESERQLDHVVLNKMFAPDGSKGFTRFKRKVYRKMLVSIYRLFTKNRSRKLYFAKLYRNYVNVNLLSDNYHHNH
ncbi:hypothetical protein FAM09_25615 [Niastella caeni]|uniref:Uncharacterized protein n=1 Tax=Niastella caeni TaxID=2569763 RepID=A0A4S8HH74_9BACT|nr:hypothetical protein [Niastella caeni]THU33529.1 hypothetical protein FAM09_25615 [Niastella caeni]